MELIKTGLDAFIFNIQKYSVNDGPGIRTVVFFKGCPLKCKWCSNPESQSFKPSILYNIDKCLNCHKCLSVCPNKAISIIDSHIHINDDLCDSCKTCVHYCDGHALEIKGKWMTVKEVIEIVKQDEVFYEEGNGGMTLSGGEFLSQSKFALELLKAAKENGLNTCCETTGMISKEIFETVIDYLDEIIIDAKHYDNDKHKEKTGVSNRMIAENIKFANSSNKNVLVRIPVIPGFNDTLTDAQNFIPYLKEIGAKKVQLLPFHQFGENKYKLLNANYEYENIDSLHKEDLQDYLDILINGGINAYF